jgi:hypothetical protein
LPDFGARHLNSIDDGTGEKHDKGKKETVHSSSPLCVV